MRQADPGAAADRAASPSGDGVMSLTPWAGLGRRLMALGLVLGLLAACGNVADGSETAAARELPGLKGGPDAPALEVGPEDDDPASAAAEVDLDDPTLQEIGPPAPVAPPPPPASREHLIAEADALIEDALKRAGGGGFTALVVDEHGRPIASHGPTDPVLPASTLKIVTAAAALVTYGPAATFETQVATTAALDGDGVLDGDLLLIGSGDPVLSTAEYRRWVYPARPGTPLEDLADEVVATGLTRITGDLIGVADRYDGPRVAEGWPDRYFNDFDARYADGLTVDAGLRTLVTYPIAPASDSDPDDVDVAVSGTSGDGVESRDDRDDLADADAEAEADDGSDAGGDEVPRSDDDEDAGSDDDGDTTEADPVVRVEHAADPAAHTAYELARLLAERGVHLAGEPRSGAADAPVVGQLASIESPPMDELLRFAVQRSDNQVTDALFRAVGRARTGIGSFESGARAIRQVLTQLGIDDEAAQFADGSGLSRDDRVTAELLVDLDRTMYASRHAATWASLMAVTGRSGTLERRLAGTAADGRFAGKTGTLRDVSGLVGSIAGAGGRRYHLAVVANDAGDARWAARGLTDDLILLLVADLDA